MLGRVELAPALADSNIRISVPFDTIEVNEETHSEITDINEIIVRENINILVVGLPRNQSGEETSQSEYTKKFAKTLNFRLIKSYFRMKA